MTKKMSLIQIEKTNNEECRLIETYKESGQIVSKGEVVGSYELGKTIVDIESPEEGYIYWGVEKNKSLIEDQIVAIILGDKITEKDIKKVQKQQGVTIYFKKEIPEKKERVSKKKINLNCGYTKVVIFGAGGHGKTCIEIIKQEGKLDIVGIIDDNKLKGEEVYGVPVIGKTSDLSDVFESGVGSIVVGIGALKNIKIRKEFADKFKEIGFKLPTIIHPSASVEPSVKLGNGVQIMQGVLIGPDTEIKDNCIINTGAIINHDCVIKTNAHITPGAILAGHVEVGENAIVGMGVTVYIGVKISKNKVIQNGTHLLQDI